MGFPSSRCLTEISFLPLSSLLQSVTCLALISVHIYAPTDGPETERANRTLEDMLRHSINPAQTDWDVRLPCCEFAVNNAWNRVTGSTPFFFNTGDHPRTPVNVDVVTPLPAANSFVGRVSAAVSSARDSLLNAQRRMSRDADKARRDEAFEIGEFVLLSTKFLRMTHVGRQKLLNKYLGPFEIVARKGAVAYALSLPPSMGKMDGKMDGKILCFMCPC